jgi:carboxylesterase
MPFGATGVSLAVLFVVAAWWRTKYLRAMTAVTLAHRRLGPDGVVIGGEGFVLERTGAPAVLLLHGGGDTPQTLRYLATDLHAAGFHVSVPLLPGHGRSLADFMRVTASDLTAAAAAAYRDLATTHEWVGVIGLSMGGALAVQIAAGNSELPALGLVAPYLAMPPWIERGARLSWLWGWIVPVVRSGDGVSILNPVERQRSLAYGVFTAAALRALQLTVHRAAMVLPRVTAPTLVVQSREDNRISVAAAERAFARLGSREKRLDWVTGVAHIITVDFGKDKVNAALIAWMQSHIPGDVRGE